MTIHKLFNSIEQALEIIDEPLTKEQKEFIFPILEIFFKYYEESIIKNIKEEFEQFINKQLVNLTDDEIFELHHKWIINSGNKDTQYDFARAIEQALKDKNA